MLASFSNDNWTMIQQLAFSYERKEMWNFKREIGHHRNVVPPEMQYLLGTVLFHIWYFEKPPSTIRTSTNLIILVDADGEVATRAFDTKPISQFYRRLKQIEHEFRLERRSFQAGSKNGFPSCTNHPDSFNSLCIGHISFSLVIKLFILVDEF